MFINCEILVLVGTLDIPLGQRLQNMTVLRFARGCLLICQCPGSSIEYVGSSMGIFFKTVGPPSSVWEQLAGLSASSQVEEKLP